MNNELITRQRLVTWEDPFIGAAQVPYLSGLAYLQAIHRGEIPPPPIAELLGMFIAEVTQGRVVFGLTPGEHHYNPIGVVHGSIAAALCDSAMGCAVQSRLPMGMVYTTAELHVNYLRPLTKETGPVRCIGEIIHQENEWLRRRLAWWMPKTVCIVMGQPPVLFFQPKGSNGTQPFCGGFFIPDTRIMITRRAAAIAAIIAFVAILIMGFGVTVPEATVRLQPGPGPSRAICSGQ